MRTLPNQRIRAGLAVVVAATLLGLGAPAVSAATVTVNLCAVAGTTSVGPASVAVWSFAEPSTPGDCSTALG